MKILFITNGFPPTRWAGTETYTAAIAGELMGMDLDVQVLCCGDWHDGQNYWNGYEDDTYSGIPVRRINLNWKKAPDPNKYLYANPVVGDYLDEYLKEARPDLVHVTSCETLSASVLSVVKKHKLPLVLTITDFWFLCPKINLLKSNGQNCNGITTPWDCLQCVASNAKAYRWLHSVLPDKAVEIFLTWTGRIPHISRQRGFRGLVGNMTERKRTLRDAFSLPDIRLTASAFVRDVHFKAGFDDPVRLHPYGHDLSWLERYSGKLPSKKIRIGFIGQIIYSKGVHLLLEAINQLEDKVRERVSVSIFGNLHKNPVYATRLMRLANGLENVEFCGTYNHDESADIFSRIDILVVPSLWYDFPLIIEESFATKTPVIATGLGQMAETITHGSNGLLFKRGDSQDLAKQIEQVSCEPGLLDRLVNGISPVETVEKQGLELLNIYKKLVDQTYD